MKKKNLLFIVVDCLRADKCYGPHKSAKTPTIDMLRRKGTTFLNAITSSTLTVPSIASVLTGTYPFLHGIRSHIELGTLNPNVTTIAEFLKQKGYNTYAEVTGPLFPQTGLNRGFDIYNFRTDGSIYSKWGESLLKRFKDRDFFEPWFLLIHLFELHIPRTIPKQYNSKEFGENTYERIVSAIDSYLGRLLEHINFKDTLIVFTGDHGEKMAETVIGEYRDKFSLTFLGFLRKLRKNRPLNQPIGHGFHVYEFLIKVPLIFVNEALFSKGLVIPDMVRLIDIFPTVIDALGIGPLNKEIHGRSLLPLVNGQHIPEVPAYCEAFGPMTKNKKQWIVGIRTSKYKFAYAPFNEKIPPELYDLENDPLEKRNIFHKQPKIAAKLKQKIIEIQSQKPKKGTEEENEPLYTKYTKKEEEMIKERLRKLGYID
jgi:arylsulfatase A-like enzyme